MPDVPRRRDGEAPTTYRLAIHVVHQAVRDLDVKPSHSSEVQARYEARLWWLSDTGGWAASRRMWLRLAGYDPDRATARIRAKLAAEGTTLETVSESTGPVSEKPSASEYVFTAGERRLLKGMPRGEVFVAEGELRRRLQASNRCRQSLIDKGALLSFGEAMFFVPPHVDPLEKRAVAEPTGSERRQQAAAL